jgi:hypothetical protein
MPTDFLSLNLFTQQPLVEEAKAEALYDILDRWRFRPSRFNDVEPIRNDWGDREKFLQQFYANCRESFGTLLVKWTKPKLDAMVMWSRGPRAKSHCISIYQAKPKDLGGAGVPYLLEIADQLFDQLNCDYGFACTDAEYHASNIYLDVPIDERTIQPKKVVGMEWPDCIPGLYWCNYFGNAYFEQGFGAHIEKASYLHRLRNGARLMRSPSADDWDAPSQREETIRLMQLLGREWFFTKATGMPERHLITDKSLFASRR